MCGIAGFIGKSGSLSAAHLEAMAASLAHRGPDDFGFWGLQGEVEHRWKQVGEMSAELTRAFAFRRLAILDLSERGAQPMQTRDGRFTLIFNGQIYNSPELKRKLPESEFHSTSDTEVLLHFLAKFGVAALGELNGMYALALHDRKLGKTWVVRDPLGIKPLYYQQTAEGTYFASEIRALRAKQKHAFSVRAELVPRYFLSNWIAEPDTLLEGVYKLPPGHLLEFDREGRLSEKVYWELPVAAELQPSLGTWLEALEASLSGAVERQLRSDVPVGFFLSGGVDSSLLSVLALPVQRERPTTFTIGFEWSGSPEIDLDRQSAARLAAQFPFDHRELILRPSIVETLPKVVTTLEEPINDPAAVCSYLICQAAAQSGYKVLISGQGGDEIFGGYPTYQAGALLDRLQALPRGLRQFGARAAECLPYALGGRRLQVVHRLKKAARALAEDWPDSLFLLRSALAYEEAAELVPGRWRADPFAAQRGHFARQAGSDIWNRLMYLDAKTYLPALNLAYSDKTSMAHSVELRVPLLDLEVVRLLARVPSRYKATPTQSKRLLKLYAERKLPREIIYRKKTGFGLPVRDWFLGDLQLLAGDVLSPRRVQESGYLDAAVVGRWLEEHREKKADHGMKLYGLLTFQMWLDTLR